eukprot:scaffold139296_cov407-Phaeocystis_antarctica.AAC.2
MIRRSSGWADNGYGAMDTAQWIRCNGLRWICRNGLRRSGHGAWIGAMDTLRSGGWRMDGYGAMEIKMHMDMDGGERMERGIWMHAQHGHMETEGCMETKWRM